MTYKGHLPLSIKVFKEGTSAEVPYVAYSPELDLSAAGRSPYKAKKILQQLIKYLLEKKEQEGTLDVFLQELGFRLLREDKKLEVPEISLIQIPFSFSTI